MANAFNKEERVAFENIIEGFQDALVLSRNVGVYSTSSTEMERSGDTIWRPQPYIAQSFTGTDMTGNFKDYTQLSVPATLGFSKAVPWTMTAKELRDALQEQRLGNAAKQKLASDINVALMNVAAQQGTLVVKRTTAATGYDDIALADALMNEQGIQAFDRYAAFSSRDYNNMASNLAGRGTMQGKPVTAYEKSYVGNVAGFETFKLDYANRLTAAAGVTVTVNGANQYYTPKATSTATTGEVGNVDNRYQNLTIAVTSGTVKVGDCFTIAGVNAVHHITKQDTGQLKTFRVTAIVSGAGGSGVVQISPPIISNGGSTDAEAEYQNVTATPANGAAITWLNTVAANVNAFWQKDALEILPGRYAVPEDAGTAVMRATTDQGIEVVFQKFYDINTMKTKYRLDTLFGVVNKQPEMSGIILFSQT
jgi:P22 coat protein - gene protein 5